MTSSSSDAIAPTHQPAHGPTHAPPEGDDTTVLPMPPPKAAPRAHQQTQPPHPHLVFDAVHDSNNTSPAPLSGGSFVQPAPPTAGAPYWQIYASGSGMEYWPHPVQQHPSGSANGYHPRQGLVFDPSSPHSIPSSDNARQQSPTPNGYAPLGLANPSPQRDVPPFDHRPSFPDMAPLHQLLSTVARGWNNPELADCMVAFHMLRPQDCRARQDDGSVPGAKHLQIHGHRLLLSQSPRLQQLFHAEPGEDRRVSSFSHWIVDRYLTPDALIIALQSLYGIPPPPLPAIKGDVASQTYVLHTALALAAAGQSLELPYLRDMAIQEARHFLNWENLELVLDFCLGNAEHLYPPSISGNDRGYAPPEPCAEAHFNYGPLARMLLMDVAIFVSDHFPPAFVLDTAIADPTYARIPPLAGSALKNNLPERLVAEQDKASSRLILHGASRSVTNVPRHASVRSIQFGDLSPAAANGEPESVGVGVGVGLDAKVNGGGPEGAAPSQAGNSRTWVLSRILLNLPFDFLRVVLENRDLGAASDSQPLSHRRRVVAEVIAAREHRRHAALEAVRSSGVGETRTLVERLKRHGPSGMPDLWDGLCWHESLVSGNNETPLLTRQWVPLPSEGT